MTSASKDRQEIERQMYDDVLETDRFPEILYEWRGAATGKRRPLLGEH